VDEVRRRDGSVLGVHAAGVLAEEPVVGRERRIAASGELVVSVGQSREHRHAVAGLDPPDALADLVDDAGRVAAGDLRERQVDARMPADKRVGV
jgi:hypothetical protein